MVNLKCFKLVHQFCNIYLVYVILRYITKFYNWNVIQTTVIKERLKELKSRRLNGIESFTTHTEHGISKIS